MRLASSGQLHHRTAGEFTKRTHHNGFVPTQFLAAALGHENLIQHLSWLSVGLAPSIHKLPITFPLASSAWAMSRSEGGNLIQKE